jgi:molybdopterin-guanine dinucleotide biosynthesis protein
MPLLMIVGWPSSGKTTVSNKILDHLQAQGKTCEVISDEYLLQKEGRNKLFRGELMLKDV